MLDTLASEDLNLDLFRLAASRKTLDFLEEQGIIDEGGMEMLSFLRERGLLEAPDDLCYAPFRKKPWLDRERNSRTRFSDGSHAVFYSALEVKTAEAELCHWVPKVFGNPTKPRTRYYACFSCEFRGVVKDLRPLHSGYPDLTAEDYSFCNTLGAEAIELGLNALLCPSARKSDGTCVPVFSENSISNATVLRDVAVTYYPATNMVKLKLLA